MKDQKVAKLPLKRKPTRGTKAIWFRVLSYYKPTAIRMYGISRNRIESHNVYGIDCGDGFIDAYTYLQTHQVVYIK